MTEKEKFQRAFAPLHASPDTMTEVMKMTERKTKRPALRRAATIGLAAALVLALGSVAYASDLGGIQRTVQLWLNGEMTDATLTVNEGSYTLRYPDKDGTEHERGGGGIAIEDDGTERALTEEEVLEHLNAPEVVYEDDGTVMLYYRGQSLDITDRFDEDGLCHLLRDEQDGGKRSCPITLNGYATTTIHRPTNSTEERKVRTLCSAELSAMGKLAAGKEICDERKIPHAESMRDLLPKTQLFLRFAVVAVLPERAAVAVCLAGGACVAPEEHQPVAEVVRFLRRQRWRAAAFRRSAGPCCRR